MSELSKIRVGVLRGGPSSEYEVSLKTGANVLQSLPEKYEPIDLYVDRLGTWYIKGLPHEPYKALEKVDIVFNAMHGEYGEDGRVQKILDAFNVPYTGSRTLASAIAMNKARTKDVLKKEKIKTPHHKTLERKNATTEAVLELFRTMPQPVVVKPLALGSSVGVSVAQTFDQLASAIERVFAVSENALIEECIRGREATCGVVNDFRGDEVYALLPIEIVPPPESLFFDYDAKYGGKTQEICPGRFSTIEKLEIQRMAALVHKAMNLRHYSRSDFIVHPTRGIYFLEVNTLPGLTNESLLPNALRAIGCSVPEFLDHVLTLALSGK